VAFVESNCRFFLSLGGGGPGCIGNIFAKVEFECLLVATIVGLEFEKDGKRGEVVRGAHGETPGGDTRFS